MIYYKCSKRNATKYKITEEILMNKKYEINVEGTKKLLEDKSHAGIFRQFWAHFMNENIEKTIETIKLTGIRTSDQPNFIAKNGQKKKNILIQDDFYVYGHLTPAAMLKTYEKFQKGWDGKFTQPEPTADVPAEENKQDELQQTHEAIDQEIEKLNATESQEEKPEEPKKLTPKEERQLKAAAAAEKQRQIREEKARKKAEREAKKLAEQQAKESQEVQEEMELPQM